MTLSNSRKPSSLSTASTNASPLEVSIGAGTPRSPEQWQRLFEQLRNSDWDFLIDALPPERIAQIARRMCTTEELAAAWGCARANVKRLRAQRRIPKQYVATFGKGKLRKIVLFASFPKPEHAPRGSLTDEQKRAWPKKPLPGPAAKAPLQVREHNRRRQEHDSEMGKQLAVLIQSTLNGATRPQQNLLNAVALVILGNKQPRDVAAELGCSPSKIYSMKLRGKRLLAPRASDDLNEWLRDR